MKVNKCPQCNRKFMVGTFKPGKDCEFKFLSTSTSEYRRTVEDLPTASSEDLGQIIAAHRFPYSKMPEDGYPLGFCKTCRLVIFELT